MAVERKQGWRGRPWLGACEAGEGSERMNDGQQRSFAQEQCARIERRSLVGHTNKQAYKQANHARQRGDGVGFQHARNGWRLMWWSRSGSTSCSSG